MHFSCFRGCFVTKVVPGRITINIKQVIRVRESCIIRYFLICTSYHRIGNNITVYDSRTMRYTEQGATKSWSELLKGRYHLGHVFVMG
jgi:hypothetical protein